MPKINLRGFFKSDGGEEPKKQRKSIQPPTHVEIDSFLPVRKEPAPPSQGGAVPGAPVGGAAASAASAGQLSGGLAPGGASADSTEKYIDLTDDLPASAVELSRSSGKEAARFEQPSGGKHDAITVSDDDDDDEVQRTKELEPSVTMQYDTANVPEPSVTMQYDAAHVPDLAQSITRFDVYESSTGVEALYGFRSLVLGVLGVVGILVLFTSHALKLVRTDPLPQQPGVGERCIRCFRVMAHDVGSRALALFPPAIADILQKMMTHSRRKSRTIFVQLLFLDFLFLHRDKHKRLEGLVSKVLLTLAGGKLVIFALDQTGRQRKRVAVQNVDDVPDDMQVLLFEFWDGEAYAADMDVFEGIDEYAGVLHGVQALPHPLGIPRNGASSTGRELRKLLADVRDQAARDGNEGPLVITAETQLPSAQLGALIAELQATFCRHANDFFVAGVQTGHDFGSGAEGLPGVTTPADSQSKLMSIPHFNSRFSGREDEPIPDSAYAPVGSSTRRVRRLGGAQGSFVVDASGTNQHENVKAARAEGGESFMAEVKAAREVRNDEAAFSKFTPEARALAGLSAGGVSGASAKGKSKQDDKPLCPVPGCMASRRCLAKWTPEGEPLPLQAEQQRQATPASGWPKQQQKAGDGGARLWRCAAHGDFVAKPLCALYEKKQD